VVNKAEELIARGEEVHFDYDGTRHDSDQALLSLHPMTLTAAAVGTEATRAGEVRRR